MQPYVSYQVDLAKHPIPTAGSGVATTGRTQQNPAARWEINNVDARAFRPVFQALRAGLCVPLRCNR